jgi:hypothetical protein
MNASNENEIGNKNRIGIGNEKSGQIVATRPPLKRSSTRRNTRYVSSCSQLKILFPFFSCLTHHFLLTK